jgi:hypothetical protein
LESARIRSVEALTGPHLAHKNPPREDSGFDLIPRPAQTPMGEVLCSPHLVEVALDAAPCRRGLVLDGELVALNGKEDAALSDCSSSTGMALRADLIGRPQGRSQCYSTAHPGLGVSILSAAPVGARNVT